MPERQDSTVTSIKQHVSIEVFAWLTRYVGGMGGGRMFFTEEFATGDDIKTVVRKLTRRFPDLDQILWDSESGQIGASVEIIINDAFLGITHTITSEVRDGDMITLLPAWDGG